MPEFFSSDGSLPLQFLVIFGVILVAMLAVYALFRRFFDRGASAPVRMGSRSRQPRLGIVDIYELDQRRQLILLRRDNVEHLLLVGGPNDVVVERNVQRVAGSRLPADTMIRPEPASDMPFLPGLDDHEEVPATAPPLAMPVVMPSPLPEPEEAKASRLDPPLFEPKLDAQDKASRPEPAPVLAAAPVPNRRDRANPVRREARPVDEPWREAAAERAASAATAPEPGVPATPTAPSAEPRPAGRSAISTMARQFESVLRKQAAPSARPVPEPAAKVEPTPPATPPETPPVAPLAPPPANPTPALAADPRPEPAPEPTLPRVAEAPVLVSAPEEPAPPAKTEPATDPVAAGMASTQKPLPKPKPEPTPEPVTPPIQPAPRVQPAAATQPVPEPVRPAAEPARPAPQFVVPARPAVQPSARIQERTVERPAERPREQPSERPSDRPLDRPPQRPEPNVVAVKPVRPAPTPPPEDKPAPETRRGANPFSVEEIEAEFARLLGRPLSRRD